MQDPYCKIVSRLRCRRHALQEPQNDSRSEILGITIHSHCALEQLLRGFNATCNAWRQPVLNGETSNEVTAEHLRANPELASPASHGCASPCDATKAHLIADAAKEVSQPDTGT